MTIKKKLFIAYYPSGVVFTDNTIHKNNDYNILAFMPYKTLQTKFKIRSTNFENKYFIDEITNWVNKEILPKKGELYEISFCGQSVKLGA